jgi:hypothetical protein
MNGRSTSTKSTSTPGPKRFFRLRPRVWAGLLFLLGLGFGTHFLWQRSAPTIARHPQYRLAADGIHITPRPPWIRSDIKSQVLRDAGLAGNISVLDDWNTLARRIKDAFEFHPWVESVTRINKRLPSSLDIELKYRRPIAAVESRDPGGVTFLPIDAHAVRLPESDLTETERRYLPRISGVTGRPLVGDVWNDPCVVGGAVLAAALADVWQQLQLVEIMAAVPPSKSRDESSMYTFEIVTKGGMRIVWGVAPGQETTAGESTMDQKRRRLLEYAADHGDLDGIEGPATIDIRHQLVVTPRTARRKSAATK